MINPNGSFIVIEGGDAVGKHTQSELLKDRLVQEGYDAELISFPRYNTTMGRIILRHLTNKTRLMERQSESDLASGIIKDEWMRAPEDAFAFQAMMLADKCDAASTINGWLAQRKVVVCDRYWQSALAYAGAEGLDKEWLLNLHMALPQPNISILIDLPPAEALIRRPKTRDRYEANRALLEQVRDNYVDMWSHPPTPRVWFQVDGMLSPSAIHDKIWSVVKNGSCG